VLSAGTARLAGVRFGEPAALLGAFARAEAVLDPLLLAVARALAAGVPLAEAARRPARVEPAPGVLVLPLRTPTLPPATHTNCVLVGERELVLIEPATPYPDEQARLRALVDELAAAGRKVVALALTHHHGDHVAAAAALREWLGVPLCAHAETARRLPGVPVDRLLGDGDELGGLRVLHTPGHAPGHLCFLEPRTRTLVAGDMVAGQGTILISPDDDGDMGVYLDSLARLRDLDLHALVPAHGPPSANPRALCAHYLAHRLQRERKLVDALIAAGGSARAAELLPRVYDDTPPAAWPLAALSLEAHLRKLAGEGRTRRQGDLWELASR
jgi:glyoxylase-like metal-dependent hydrolase (beta-lactamase superfamily II)